jgi:hypothetical protein
MLPNYPSVHITASPLLALNPAADASEYRIILAKGKKMTNFLTNHRGRGLRPAECRQAARGPDPGRQYD